MNDKVFLDSFYWLLMNRDFVLISSGMLTFFVIVLSLIIIIKKWGESY